MSTHAQTSPRQTSAVTLLLASTLTVLHPIGARAALTFANTARLSVDVGSDGPQAIGLSDVNKDNRPDIVAVNRDQNTITVFLNDGAGGFSSAQAFNVGAGPVAVTTGDFDRDGNVDVVTANGNSNTVTILFGDGTGAFNTARQDYPVGPAPVGIAVADFDSDQIPDLGVLSDSAIYLLKNAGNRTFAPFSPASVGTRSVGAFAIAVGHFNVDAFPDLVVSNIASNNVSVFLGNGNGTFKAARAMNTGSGPTGLAVGDFDGDAKQDVAVVDSSEIADLNVSLLFGRGDGTFADAVRTTAEVDSRAIVAADLTTRLLCCATIRAARLLKTDSRFKRPSGVSPSNRGRWQFKLATSMATGCRTSLPWANTRTLLGCS